MPNVRQQGVNMDIDLHRVTKITIENPMQASDNSVCYRDIEIEFGKNEILHINLFSKDFQNLIINNNGENTR